MRRGNAVSFKGRKRTRAKNRYGTRAVRSVIKSKRMF